MDCFFRAPSGRTAARPHRHPALRRPSNGREVSTRRSEGEAVPSARRSAPQAYDDLEPRRGHLGAGYALSSLVPLRLPWERDPTRAGGHALRSGSHRWQFPQPSATHEAPSGMENARRRQVLRAQPNHSEPLLSSALITSIDETLATRRRRGDMR